jgi:hypothetical protein
MEQQSQSSYMQIHGSFNVALPTVVLCNSTYQDDKNKTNKLNGLSPQANYTEGATATCRQS